MISRALVVLVAFLFAFAAPTASVLRAQDEQLTAAAKQELARNKFQDLTDRMKVLMPQIQKSEPGDSHIIDLALRFVQEKKMIERLERSGNLLKQESWDLALVEMSSLKEDLQKLLNLLQDRDDDLRKLLEEIKRLDGFKNRVDQLAKEQGEEKKDSALTEELQKHLAEIEAKKKEAQALLEQQKAVRDQTNSLGLQTAAEATKPLADKEGQLHDDTDKLAKSLENLEKKNDDLAKAAAKGSPSAKPGDSKPGDAKPGSCNCSGSAGQAAKSMGQAQQQLGDKKPESSLKDQDQAIQNLQKTVDELEKMAEDARRELLKLPFEQQAKKQDDTQHATDTLSKDMEKSEEKGENGEAPKATPGKKRVQQAVPKQRAAAGQLKEYKTAKQKQQDAKDDLEAAKKELEDALAQLRQQLQDEVLRALEERFTAMLARQRELSAQTKALDGTRDNLLTANGQLPAAMVERLAQLATGEGELETEASDALKLLEEDATTAVFPPMVEQLRDDLGGVAKRLQAQQSGAPTQTAQREVEDLLALLINALRKTIELKAGGH